MFAPAFVLSRLNLQVATEFKEKAEASEASEDKKAKVQFSTQVCIFLTRPLAVGGMVTCTVVSTVFGIAGTVKHSHSHSDIRSKRVSRSGHSMLRVCLWSNSISVTLQMSQILVQHMLFTHAGSLRPYDQLL